MKVQVVEKQIPMDLFTIVKFQITQYCFQNNIRISPSQLDTLSYLGMWGEMNISDFCEQIVEMEIFSNPQTVRNFIIKSVKDGYIVRKGTGSKLIVLSDQIELLNSGNIVIKMNVFHVDKSQKSD